MNGNQQQSVTMASDFQGQPLQVVARKQIVIRDNQEQKIGRIHGGWAWPSKDQPGYVCVGGEEEFPEIGHKTIYHMHLLEEVSEPYLDRLIEMAVDLARKYRFSEFYANIDSAQMQPLWRRRQARLPCVNLRYGQYTDAGKIGYHAALLRDVLTPPRNTLHGLSQSLAAAQIQAAPPSCVDVGESEYPALAAMGYVVDSLKSFPPDGDDEYYDHGERERERSKDSMTGW